MAETKSRRELLEEWRLKKAKEREECSRRPSRRIATKTPQKLKAAASRVGPDRAISKNTKIRPRQGAFQARTNKEASASKTLDSSSQARSAQHESPSSLLAAHSSDPRICPAVDSQSPACKRTSIDDQVETALSFARSGDVETAYKLFEDMLSADIDGSIQVVTDTEASRSMNFWLSLASLEEFAGARLAVMQTYNLAFTIAHTKGVAEERECEDALEGYLRRTRLARQNDTPNSAHGEGVSVEFDSLALRYCAALRKNRKQQSVATPVTPAANTTGGADAIAPGAAYHCLSNSPAKLTSPSNPAPVDDDSLPAAHDVTPDAVEQGAHSRDSTENGNFEPTPSCDDSLGFSPISQTSKLSLPSNVAADTVVERRLVLDALTPSPVRSPQSMVMDTDDDESMMFESPICSDPATPCHPSTALLASSSPLRTPSCATPARNPGAQSRESDIAHTHDIVATPSSAREHGAATPARSTPRRFNLAGRAERVRNLNHCDSNPYELRTTGHCPSDNLKTGAIDPESASNASQKLLKQAAERAKLHGGAGRCRPEDGPKKGKRELAEDIPGEAGRLTKLARVRATSQQRAEFGCETVVTPVRRSARINKEGGSDGERTTDTIADLAAKRGTPSKKYQGLEQLIEEEWQLFAESTCRKLTPSESQRKRDLVRLTSQILFQKSSATTPSMAERILKETDAAHRCLGGQDDNNREDSVVPVVPPRKIEFGSEGPGIGENGERKETTYMAQRRARVQALLGHSGFNYVPNKAVMSSPR